MTRPVKFDVRSEEEGKHALQFFNAFHDGFIKRLTAISQDDFAPDKSQRCTGRFDVELELAHYNYRQGQPAYSQRILASFRDVQDLHCDFRDFLYNSPIQSLAIEKGQRSDGNSTEEEPCLVLKAAHSILEMRGTEQRWVHRMELMFTFSIGSFVEQ